MENLKFNVGDNVKIVSNDLQPAMVGKIGRVKKVYPSFSEDSDNNVQPSYFYRVEVGGAVLKGIAASSDLEKVQKNDMKKYRVTIDLDAFEIVVSANNKAEAKRKAIEILQRKKITSLIRKSWPDNKKEVYVDEE